MCFKKFISFPLILFFLTLNVSDLQAQFQQDYENENHQEVCSDPFNFPVVEDSFEPANWSLFGGDISCLSHVTNQKQTLRGTIDVRTPNVEIYERLEWPDPRINFAPGGVGTPAGDLTGNGFTDLVRVYPITIDERTDTPHEFIAKTLIFEGGDTVQKEPDFILYDGMVPVGDINGTGKTNLKTSLYPHKYFEFNGSEFIEVSFTDNSNLDRLNMGRSVIISDLDGDGFNDWVLNNTQIYFGADHHSSFELKEYDISNLLNGSASSYSFNNVVTIEGVKYIILPFTVGNMQDPIREAGSYLGILRITENRDLELVQEIKISSLTRMLRPKYFAATIPGDEHPSLIYYNYFESFQDDNPSEYQAFRIPPSDEPDQLFENDKIPFYPALLWSAGDLTGDGSTDFIVYNDEDSLYYHGEFDETDNELKIGKKLPYQDDFRFIYMPTSIPTEASKVSSFGDQTGNGRDDFFLSISPLAPVEVDGGASFGQLRVFADANGQYSYEPIVYALKDYQRTTAQNIYIVGDVTGNGIDDFIIYYSRTQNFRPEIVLHEGGAAWKDPYYTWALEENRILDDLTAGYFTSENRRDIIMLTSIDNPRDGMPHSKIEITKGGSELSAASYFDIDFDEYLNGNTGGTPQFYRFGMVENAGDVNNSGFDDLLISTPQLNLPPGLYFGNEQLSSDGPDLFLDFEDGYLGPNDHRGNYMGTSLKGLGDITGNGIDDFAIADIEATLFESVIEFGNGSIGAVHIYYGRNEETPDFSTPDLTLRSDTIALRNGANFYRFGFSEIAAGNFRNTGNQDIVVKSASHFDNSSREGVPGIHIFHQGITEGQPQQILPLHSDLMAPHLDMPLMPSMNSIRMAGIPDINNNGHDELLLMSTSTSAGNAVLHLGSDEFSKRPNILFTTSEDDFTFTTVPFDQIGWSQPRAPLGDITGDGTINLLMGQRNIAYRDDPVYMFEINEVMVSNEHVSHRPEEFLLKQNYPNPFNPTTVINYQLPNSSDVKLEVFDMLGRRVSVLVEGNQSAGTYSVEFDASSLSSGVYLYRLQTNENVQTRQMVLVN